MERGWKPAGEGRGPGDSNRVLITITVPIDDRHVWKHHDESSICINMLMIYVCIHREKN